MKLLAVVTPLSIYQNYSFLFLWSNLLYRYNQRIGYQRSPTLSAGWQHWNTGFQIGASIAIYLDILNLHPSLRSMGTYTSHDNIQAYLQVTWLVMARFLIFPINFTRPPNHGSNLLQMAPLPSLIRNPWPPGLNIRTYNVRDSRGFGTPQAIRTNQVGNYNIMIMT